ncbi:hypothetical protein ACMATS_32640 [Streptoverticillium reticulum]|uniref:hypothetical protein n=1 Tax=Streptoverticillium reticulum TaxID=1433415 RepID=UPI0039BEF662
MTYESPLAYLLGLEDLALLRSFTGERDREFADDRIAEIRELLASSADAAVDVARVSTVDGYGSGHRPTTDPTRRSTSTSR